MRFVRNSGAILGQSHRRAVCAFALAACLFSGAAAAVDFPVSGSISINGNTGALPDGTFQGSSYDPATGAIGAGTFKFPQATVTNGANSLTYQLSQTGTSTGLVDASGVATFNNVSLAVTLLYGSYNGLPVTFGSSCVFAPIPVMLVGSGSAAGVDVADPSFAIPPTTDSCNSFASMINPVVGTSSNSIQLHLDGDFTPPGTIFANGFESAR